MVLILVLGLDFDTGLDGGGVDEGVAEDAGTLVEVEGLLLVAVGTMGGD